MPSVRDAREHISAFASVVLLDCSTAQCTYICSGQPENAVCDAEAGNWVAGVGGSVGPGTRYSRDCHLRVTVTCSVPHGNLGGLSPWLLPTLFKYTHALGNGLSITSLVQTDQAESSSGTNAHVQHNGETEGNLRVCALMPILYPDRCVRMYSVFPCHGARAAEL